MTAQRPSVSDAIFSGAKSLFKTLTLIVKGLFNKKKTSLSRYEWLYRSGSDCSKLPPINITASLQHIRLSLGTSGSQSTRNPLLHLRDILEEYVDVGRAIKVTAKLETGQSPPEQGLRRLGEYLAYIGNEEIDFKHWTELDVSFPTNEPLPFTVDSRPSGSSLPQNALTNLKRLTWSAHREQLTASWLPFTPSLLYTLTNLVICCDISPIDCSHILHYGKQLKELTVRTLRRDLLHCSVLSQQFYASDVAHLTSLTLRSDDDLVSLLTQCKFPSLRHIDLDLLYPTTLTFRSFKFWSNLETINLSGDLEKKDVYWIGTQCSHVRHVFIPGLAVFHCSVTRR